MSVLMNVLFFICFFDNYKEKDNNYSKEFKIALLL